MNRISLVLDRYERMTASKLAELKKLQKCVLEGGNRDNLHVRNTISQYENQLLQGLEQAMKMRDDVDPQFHDLFEQRIEPIRKQIQTCVNMNRNLPELKIGRNPFEEQEDEDENPYETESKRYIQESAKKESEMRQFAQDAKEKAEATRKIEQEMQDLEQIFSELSRIVHEQHEVVDSIEEQVERANEDVKRGNEQLKKAVASKAAKTPLVAGVIGGLAIGGPVGLTAGSAIAGIAAGVGGLVAGLYTGRFFKKAATEEATSTT
ncbi:unnamed protein product [Caenorhabditis angaria]|uniref:t-SNARE coiled-coil homology domain-containing protein n=1 Tax=Caenorhabditis angaria TaxID=860376 RepID=A0A9P1I4G2_9PELO|nr:unnamed protein product [Caenorhabditis angaria]